MGKNGDRGTASKISYTEKEYIFDSKTRKASRGTILTFVTIGGVCVLTAVVLALIQVLNGKRPEDTIHGALVILMIGCITFLYPVQECRRMHWLLGKCRINENGIYIHPTGETVKFVPWCEIVAVERKKMNLDALTHVTVICCYKSLAGKTLLERAPKMATQNLLYQEFYRLRDEVVTIGYTKERMGQIRSFLDKESNT